MDVSVRSGRVCGRIRVPGSKSIAQRALILATRDGGVVRNVPDSEDLDRMCAGLRALGFTVEERPGARAVSGAFHGKEATIDAGDNATGARCLTALASLRGVWTTIDGSERLRGGTVRLSTEISSQFATALILVVPRVKGLRVNVAGKRSFSYVGLTAHVQRHFSDPFDVEPDFSSAAALAVGAATTRGDLFLDGLSISSPQPDARIVPFLNKAGARVTAEEGGIRVQGGALQGIQADLANSPDLGPLLGALGALANGETVVRGAPHLIHKESDRIASTVGLVRALGGDATTLDDGFVVRGGRRLHGATVSSAGDHRIAMAAGVLALSIRGVTVTGAESVRKSYPDFFKDLDSLTE